MSIKLFSDYVVPERTASVARAAFPNGSLCIRIFDELGTIFQDQDFADLYSHVCSRHDGPNLEKRKGRHLLRFIHFYIIADNSESQA